MTQSGIKKQIEFSSSSLEEHLRLTLQVRQEHAPLPQDCALRLFNGFYEGCPGLIAEFYARCLLLTNHAEVSPQMQASLSLAQEFYLSKLPEIQTVLVKQRRHPDYRLGQIVFGTELPQQIRENGVNYALNLQLNQDNSFYPDTRLLRHWLKEHSQSRRVLNCFAYTGSLGIACLAGGASFVLQTDRSTEALNLAQRSATLNGFSDRMQNLQLDFFEAMARLKGEGQLFDCVILDPPFFSSSSAGKVDLLKEWQNLINKVRPLVAHEGRLILINNALYLSGAELMQVYEGLCASGYLRMEEIIPVPTDCSGSPETIVSLPPTAPAPYNHPTKITVLRALRKDQRRA